MEGGSDAYHCTSDPYLLDPWRTALFIGALADHPNIRVIGVDGRVGPLVESAMATLCRDGWLTGRACSSGAPLAYEETNQGYGWYHFHHHHMHVSYSP